MSTHKTSISKDALGLLLAGGLVVLIRAAIYLWMNSNGYFYGVSWDSFSRLGLAYNWAQHPFFAPADGYWLPLQFWLGGILFVLISPWIKTCEILVMVFLNQIFFAASILVLYRFTLKITQKTCLAVVACVLAAFFAGDILVSYTALSDPILVFCFLLANDQFYRLVIEGRAAQKRTLLAIGVTGWAASATHYIGWFLAAFIGVYLLVIFFSALIQKDYLRALAAGIAGLLCVAMPAAWLWNNYLIWGNPLYPTQVVRQFEAGFIGQMTPLARFLVTPKVILKEFYPITVLGLAALPVILFKKDKAPALFFMAPSVFILAMIWLLTWAAFSSPFREPRYLIFAGWMLIPMIALAIGILWSKKWRWLQAAIGLALLGSIFLNLRQASAFQNSFGPEVQAVSGRVREWLNTQPESAQVVLHSDSFAEQGVIPMISGYPYRFQWINAAENAAICADPASFFNLPRHPWLLIAKNSACLPRAQEKGLRVEKVEPYVLIYGDFTPQK